MRKPATVVPGVSGSGSGAELELAGINGIRVREDAGAVRLDVVDLHVQLLALGRLGRDVEGEHPPAARAELGYVDPRDPPIAGEQVEREPVRELDERQVHGA